MRQFSAYETHENFIKRAMTCQIQLGKKKKKKTLVKTKNIRRKSARKSASNPLIYRGKHI